MLHRHASLAGYWIISAPSQTRSAVDTGAAIIEVLKSPNSDHVLPQLPGWNILDLMADISTEQSSSWLVGRFG
jgi:hypothetical protein